MGTGAAGGGSKCAEPEWWALPAQEDLHPGPAREAAGHHSRGMGQIDLFPAKVTPGFSAAALATGYPTQAHPRGGSVFTPTPPHRLPALHLRVKEGPGTCPTFHHLEELPLAKPASRDVAASANPTVAPEVAWPVQVPLPHSLCFLLCKMPREAQGGRGCTPARQSQGEGAEEPEQAGARTRGTAWP